MKFDVYEMKLRVYGIKLRIYEINAEYMKWNCSTGRRGHGAFWSSDRANSGEIHWN